MCFLHESDKWMDETKKWNELKAILNYLASHFMLVVVCFFTVVCVCAKKDNNKHLHILHPFPVSVNTKDKCQEKK